MNNQFAIDFETKMWSVFILFFVFFICDGATNGQSISDGNIRKNLTALHQIKTQIYKMNDAAIIKSLKKKVECDLEKNIKMKLDENLNKKRIKRKTKKENLDNLYPTLSIRSVNINVDWFNFAKNANSSYIGASFTLSDGKSLVAHVMNIGLRGSYYTIPSLEQDRVYRGEIKLLTEIDEVKNFIRKQSNKKNVEEFELTTPFIVPGNI